MMNKPCITCSWKSFTPTTLFLPSRYLTRRKARVIRFGVSGVWMVRGECR